ncbi:LLM class flavin-dependent oxidoreductase, partial [Methylobacterium crusticola]|uniref:LLM class flavin-dependent oxidoreductase n=1 Tax=Methylobacterium crusticola TaxID=1697972 RepID=UPI001EE2E3D0
YLNVAAHSDVAVARRVVRGSIGTMAHFSSMTGAPLDEVAASERGVVRNVGEDYQLALHGDVRAVHLQKVDDAFIDRFGVVGTPEQVVDR